MTGKGDKPSSRRTSRACDWILIMRESITISYYTCTRRQLVVSFGHAGVTPVDCCDICRLIQVGTVVAIYIVLYRQLYTWHSLSGHLLQHLQGLCSICRPPLRLDSPASDQPPVCVNWFFSVNSPPSHWTCNSEPLLPLSFRLGVRRTIVRHPRVEQVASWTKTPWTQVITLHRGCCWINSLPTSS